MDAMKARDGFWDIAKRRHSQIQLEEMSFSVHLLKVL
jgi:hypothetical protein